MKPFRLILLSTILTVSCLAQAPQCHKTPVPTPTPTPTPTPAPNPVTSTNSSNSSSTSSSSSSSSSTSVASGGSGGQGGQGGAGGSSSIGSVSSTSGGGSGYGGSATGGNAQGGSASNGAQSNAQSTTYNDNTPRQAPPATAPLILPTASCLGGMSAGASAPVGGLSFGSSKVDKECRLVALANEFIAMGQFDTAAKVLCSTKSAKEAHLSISDCRHIVPAPLPVIEAPVLPVTVSNPLPALPIVIYVPVLQTSIDVHPPKKRVVHHLSPNCQNVVQKVCKTPQEK